MRLKKWLGLVLSALLLFAAGCESVQGVDLNSVLKQSQHVKAYEGSMVFELDVKLSEDLLDEIAAEDEESASFVPLLTHVKFELDEIKVKDPVNASMRGKLTLGDIGIGFGIRQAGTIMVMELDGAAAPIVIDMAAMQEEFPGAVLTPEQQLELQEMALKAADSANGYLIGNMPNVSDISVELNAPVKVGGEELKLTKIGVRFDGAELLEWLKSYLKALTEDKEGLRAFIGAIETYIRESAGLFGEFGPTDDEGQADFGLNEDEFVEMLQMASLSLAYLETTEPELAREIFGENLTVSADLYVDGKLDIRRQDVEVNFRPDGKKLAELAEEESLAGLEGIRIYYSQELWNINGDVAIDATTVEGGVTVEEMEDWSTADTLRFFRGTGLYKLLANMGVGEQELWLFPDIDERAPIKSPDGQTLVPLRSVAEYFEAEVGWDHATKTITVNDDATGKNIVLKVGSSRAVVNDEAVEWAYPVIVIDGLSYAPGGSLLETLGGTMEWTDEEEDWRALILSRHVAELITS